jgi:purine nucleosidase
MGGALRCPGNITPAAEFNFYADPIAAQTVLAAGARVVLFPLDVTSAAVMSAEWIASFHQLDSRCGKAAAAMLEAYARFDPLLHDACPVAYLLDPSLFGGERCQVDVDCRSGPTEGHCLAHYGQAHSNVMGIDNVHLPRLLQLVYERIGNLP